MQKALILALLIGAFLLPGYVTAEDPDPELPPQYECLDGGTLEEYEGVQICSLPAPSGEVWEASNHQHSVKGQGSTQEKALDAMARNLGSKLSKSTTNDDGNGTILVSTTSVSHVSTNVSTSRVLMQISNTYSLTCPSNQEVCNPPASSSFNAEYPGSLSVTTSTYCPPDDYQKLTNIGGEEPNLFCWIEATLVTDEPPPECDDVVGNCTPPEDDPKCFRGGAGQQVCFEDPNDKCDVSSVNGEPVYTNCEAGCGFVNDNFVCSEEPDIPNLDDCYVTTNGYACPPDVPEPDDNIDNPDKPINDMKKGDFKDVLIGVETRMDASNKLTADQIARDKENTDAITGQLAKANSYLKEIDKNAKAIADGMEGLGTDGEPAGMGDVGQYKSEINSMLGITGDESIEDLTVDEINLGEFKDDFAFSLGASNCPQPRAINMLGKTFYMDWGPFCEAFTVMGYLIMAAAYFMATLIAFKGK